MSLDVPLLCFINHTSINWSAIQISLIPSCGLEKKMFESINTNVELTWKYFGSVPAVNHLAAGAAANRWQGTQILDWLAVSPSSQVGG